LTGLAFATAVLTLALLLRLGISQCFEFVRPPRRLAEVAARRLAIGSMCTLIQINARRRSILILKLLDRVSDVRHLV
jgi:hypothetical protein